jgi:D-glucosaminate-6-phosphate ammonia-lyase
MSDLHRRYELTPVINLSGPLTMYGTSISSEGVVNAAAESLRHHWNMDELFQRSGELLAQWSGAEAGVLTSSSASGCTLAVAACMTGSDMGRIGQLPDPTGMRDEVVIQMGHAVNFGAPIEQMIRLAGATPLVVGTVNRTTPAQIEHALGPQTVAAMFVVSHHTAQYGYVQLDAFVSLCRQHGVPVIIDAAAQDHQIERLVASGADLIVLSVQKYLAGPTGGIVVGRKDLVEAVYRQNWGIGRTMKIGKEGIFGAMVAIEERMAISLTDWAAEQRNKAERLSELLQGLAGVRVFTQRDSVGQPIVRVRLEVDPDEAGITAEGLARALEHGTPSIKPRAHHTDEGWFYLEPNHVTDEELRLTAERIRNILSAASSETFASNGKVDAFLAWVG